MERLMILKNSQFIILWETSIQHSQNVSALIPIVMKEKLWVLHAMANQLMI